jgi:hypothetical protein
VTRVVSDDQAMCHTRRAVRRAGTAWRARRLRSRSHQALTLASLDAPSIPPGRRARDFALQTRISYCSRSSRLLVCSATLSVNTAPPPSCGLRGLALARCSTSKPTAFLPMPRVHSDTLPHHPRRCPRWRPSLSPALSALAASSSPALSASVAPSSYHSSRRSLCPLSSSSYHVYWRFRLGTITIIYSCIPALSASIPLIIRCIPALSVSIPIIIPCHHHHSVVHLQASLTFPTTLTSILTGRAQVISIPILPLGVHIMLLCVHHDAPHPYHHYAFISTCRFLRRITPIPHHSLSAVTSCP